ncbi:MAG TPA: hypothetical protein PKB14_01415 [Rubrivivax sp.]|nr:hypothetical protein [Rubrivivax sp.]
MSNYDDTPSLPGRLHQVQRRLLVLAADLDAHSATTAVHLADLLGDDAAVEGYMDMTDGLRTEAWKLYEAVRSIRTDLVRAAPPLSIRLGA